jgi:hypothetical protein
VIVDEDNGACDFGVGGHTTIQGAIDVAGDGDLI